MFFINFFLFYSGCGLSLIIAVSFTESRKVDIEHVESSALPMVSVAVTK